MKRLTEKKNGENVIPLRQDGRLEWSLRIDRDVKPYEQFLYGVHADKLAEYEDLEEQNRLIKLPCEVGNTIWNNDWGKPCSFEVTGFSFGSINESFVEEEIVIDQVLVYYTNSSGSITGSFEVSKIGKTVFHTQEEAEAALRELAERETI